MASTLPYISREELDELEQELRATKEGYSPDIDALQCTVLLDLIAAFRMGQIVGCAPPDRFSGVTQSSSQVNKEGISSGVHTPGNSNPAKGLVVHDAVWEALQRLIENAASLGPSSQEDAMVVARWRGQFIAAREAAGNSNGGKGDDRG